MQTTSKLILAALISASHAIQMDDDASPAGQLAQAEQDTEEDSAPSFQKLRFVDGELSSFFEADSKPFENYVQPEAASDDESDDDEDDDNILAQLFAPKDRCKQSQKRLSRWGTEKNFYDIQEGTELYKDKGFQGKNAISWLDAPHSRYGGDLKSDRANIKWKRAKSLIKEDRDYSLWGDNGVSASDILQGGIGNCWFLTAAAAMAEEDGRLESMFINVDDTSVDGISKNGIYAIKMYALMTEIVVTIDDRIPVWKNGNNWRTAYAQVGADGSLWGPLLEKAFADYHGTYEAIVGGWPMVALNTLAGAPGESCGHTNECAEDLWERLQALPENAMVQSTTRFGWKGIVGGHAYTLLQTLQVGENGPKLLQVRNPWGNTEFTGPWSDSSDLWTPELKADYGLDAKEDGTFFIELADYLKGFDGTSINHDVSDWSKAEFLMLNDKSEEKGTHPQCGETCTRHEFTLTSTIDQEVIISANLWQLRGYPAMCDPFGFKYNLFVIDGVDGMAWEFGSAMLKPIQMTAGQSLSAWLELDYESRDMLKDFSVVAWGKEGELTLTHDLGTKSKKFWASQGIIEGEDEDEV